MSQVRAARTTAALRGVSLLGILLLLAFAAWTLTRSPCLGVADNLDSWRVMRPAGISHVEPVHRPGVFVRCTFSVEDANFSTLVSSSAFLAWVAKITSWGLAPEPGLMDLRQMGMVYLLLVALGVALALAWKVPAPLLLGLVYVLVDPGYLLFFNSFYADSTVFVALLGLTFWLLRWGAEPWQAWDGTGLRGFVWASLLVGLAVLGGGAKMQFVLLPAVLLVTLAIPFVREQRKPTWKSLTVVLLLMGLSAAVPWHFFRGSGPRFSVVNNYHAVYAGLLVVSDEPEDALRRLGVPKDYWDLPRRDVFSADIPPDHPVHTHLAELSRSRLALLYLRQPSNVTDAMRVVQNKLARKRPHTRGNSVRGEAPSRPRRWTVPWQWSRVRAWLFHTWPPFTWLLVGAGLAWTGMRLWTGSYRHGTLALLFLLSWFLSQLPVIVLGDGFVALEQHLLAARLALDVALWVFVYDVLCSHHVRDRLPCRGASYSPGSKISRKPKS